MRMTDHETSAGQSLELGCRSAYSAERRESPQSAETRTSSDKWVLVSRCPVTRTNRDLRGRSQTATSLRLGCPPTTRSSCCIPYRQQSSFAVRLNLGFHLACDGQKTQKSKALVFDAQAFLDSAGVARKVVEYRRVREASTLKVIPLRVSCTFKEAV